VSLDGVTFSAAVTVAGSGTIAATPVYIRLTDTTAAGSYAGNIMLSSAGVLHINVAMPASEVSPAPLTITANNQTRAYGTANPAFTVTYSGFVNNQGPASLTALPVATTTAAVNSLPGQYPITAGGAASPDYSFTYFPGVLTITAGFANTIIPNAFTPNGDGINDTWNIQYLSTYPNCTVQIFNRYGQKLFYSEGYPLPWDGTYNGVKVPDGIYYYIINLNGGQSSIAGHVTVIR
jgi:gliding motility-associated-like protein